MLRHLCARAIKIVTQEHRCCQACYCMSSEYTWDRVYTQRHRANAIDKKKFENTSIPLLSVDIDS
jgi:hypothetical protein